MVRVHAVAFYKESQMFKIEVLDQDMFAMSTKKPHAYIMQNGIVVVYLGKEKKNFDSLPLALEAHPELTVLTEEEIEQPKEEYTSPYVNNMHQYSD